MERRTFLKAAGSFALVGWDFSCPDAFTFAHATDLHSSETSEMLDWERGALDVPYKFVKSSFVDDLNALNPRPSFTVLTGDLISHTNLNPGCWARAEEKWRRYKRLITDRLEMPYHQIIGNNDCASVPYRKVYADRPMYWSFEQGRILFAGLHGYDCWKVENSNHAGILYGAEQLAWLADVVRRSMARTLVLFTHEPLFSFDTRLACAQLAPIVDAFRGEAIWNICGHEHENNDCVMTIGSRSVRCVETMTPVGSWKPGNGDYRVFFCQDGLVVDSILHTCTLDGAPVRTNRSPNWEMPPKAKDILGHFPKENLKILLPGEKDFVLGPGCRKVQDRISVYYIACANGDGWYPMAKDDPEYALPGRLVIRVPRQVNGKAVRAVHCVMKKPTDRILELPPGSGDTCDVVLENDTGKCDFVLLGCALI